MEDRRLPAAGDISAALDQVVAADGAAGEISAALDLLLAPEDPAAESSPRGTVAWSSRPLPMAPPIPPLDFPITPSAVKPLPDPEPAVIAAAPLPTAPRAANPMMR